MQKTMQQIIMFLLQKNFLFICSSQFSFDLKPVEFIFSLTINSFSNFVNPYKQYGCKKTTFFTTALLRLIFLRFHPVLYCHLLKHFRLHQPCNILCVSIFRHFGNQLQRIFHPKLFPLFSQFFCPFFHRFAHINTLLSIFQIFFFLVLQFFQI